MSSVEGEAAAAKKALRTRMLVERAALPAAARAEACAKIARRLEALPELTAARSVLGYASFGTEVDLDPFLTACLTRGVQVYLPWVDGEDLRVASVPDLVDALAPGWQGVREPAPTWRRDADPGELDAAVVPGIAFDQRAHRLGYGGGHFDRLLARLPPSTFVVGVGFDVQVVDAVPVEDHDVPLDAVVTESRTLRAAT